MIVGRFHAFFGHCHRNPGPLPFELVDRHAHVPQDGVGQIDSIFNDAAIDDKMLEFVLFQMHDHADEMAQLAQAIEQYWRRILDVASNSCAEVIFLGANYDASVTYPPFFAEHIMPWLREYAQVLHAQGKFLLTHTDGENTGLMEHYLAADIDIADSVCPAPMTKMTFREARDALQGKVTIMGGIPSVTLLEDSMSDAEFEKYLDGFFADMGQGDRLILGVSDTTPPAAKFVRLMQVGRRAAAFRPGS